MRRLIEKILYGNVETGVNAVETFIRLHLLVFYSKEVGIAPAWVGIALGISILWDAAIDPLIGRFSDQFKNKNGTRMHLVLTGAIATCVTLSALYRPPHLETPQGRWLYLLICALLFNTSQTLFSIPYTAMVGDYSSNRQERSQFIAWRLVFANVGAILGIAIPGYYLARGEENVYGNASWILVMVVAFVALLGSLAPPPLRKRTLPETKKTRHPLLQALASRPFLFLLGGSVVVNVALTISTSMALYFYRLRLQLPEREIQNALLLFFLFFSASVPFWLWLSKRLGRKWALIAGAVLLAITNSIVYLWLPEGDPVKTYIFASFLSGFLAGSSVLLESILTDVVDYDYFERGEERFGLYFGVWKFSAKFSRAFSMLLVGFLLDWANVAFPDPDTPSRLSLIFGPGVGVFFLLAALFLLPYPLTEKRVIEIKAELEKRAHG